MLLEIMCLNVPYHVRKKNLRTEIDQMEYDVLQDDLSQS